MCGAQLASLIMFSAGAQFIHMQQPVPVCFSITCQVGAASFSFQGDSALHHWTEVPLRLTITVCPFRGVLPFSGKSTVFILKEDAAESFKIYIKGKIKIKKIKFTLRLFIYFVCVCKGENLNLGRRPEEGLELQVVVSHLIGN